MNANSLKNRYDFVMLFDVTDGNPNGDPDADNSPRVDPETQQGLISDVCIKRKIRNRVQLEQEGKSGYDIYVREKSILSEQQERAYKALNITDTSEEEETATASEATTSDSEPTEKKKAGRKPKIKENKQIAINSARTKMCEIYYDVRTFGAVMSTKLHNCGQVRGPVQITFSRSIDPIVPLDLSITRMAVANPDESAKMGGLNTTMGRKHIVPYGLYKGFGFVSAPLARQTGFTTNDLEVLFTSIRNMFETDRSAARGLMVLRELIIFKHDSELGNAPSHTLFDLVKIVRKDNSKPTRNYNDYTVIIDNPPNGVTRV